MPALPRLKWVPWHPNDLKILLDLYSKRRITTGWFSHGSHLYGCRLTMAMAQCWARHQWDCQSVFLPCWVGKCKIVAVLSLLFYIGDMYFPLFPYIHQEVSQVPFDASMVQWDNPGSLRDLQADQSNVYAMQAVSIDSPLFLLWLC